MEKKDEAGPGADLEADSLEIATQTAAQAWCTEDTKHKVMDPILCVAFARILAGWIGTARQHARNEDYYRGLLDQCAQHLGEAVYIQDDGGRYDEPLRAKIPELVEALAARSATPKEGSNPPPSGPPRRARPGPWTRSSGWTST